MRFLLPALFLATVALPASETLPADARLQHVQWPAYWIACPDSPHNEYGVYLFRKVLSLDRVPEHYRVHVSADARYRLWINGAPIGFGPQRGAPSAWRYDTFDLAPHLRKGANVIAARVISYGEHEPLAIMTTRTGFLLQGDTAAEDAIDSNASWKVSRDEAYAPRPIDHARVPGYFAVGPGEILDAARHPWNWTAGDFDDHDWRPARQLDRGIPWGQGTDVGNWLLPRTIPAMEETVQRFATIRRAEGVQPGRGFVAGAAPFTIPPHSHATVLLDQGVNTNGFVRLAVSGGRGSHAGLTYAEALLDAQGRKGNRNDIDGRTLVGLGDELLPDGGDREYETIDFRTFRYLQLEVQTAGEPLVVRDLASVFTAYPFRSNATFESDDATLKPVVDVAWRTARLCAFETYMDCPYYEQLQYVGDTRLQALISLYVSGDDRLVRNAIDLLDRSRIADGLTQSRYPSQMPQVINTFSLFWIDMVHDYWMHRPDDAFVRERLPGLQSVLGWFERRLDPKTGLLGPLSYWSFVDWTEQWSWNGDLGIGGEPAGAREGGSAIISLQLAGTLDRAAELCRAHDRPDLADHYGKLADGLRKAVLASCWDEKRRLVADTPAKTAFSQHANALAVLSGAITGDAAHELMQRVAHDESLIQCSTYFRFYLLRAMKKAGLGDEYLSMLGPWRTMLERGLTTFAEQPDPTRSDCHAWSASPLYELYATVAGIEPGSPGFATVRIEPHLGALRRLAATMPHPEGQVAVSYVRNGSGLQATVTLPAGVTGRFVWKGQSTPLHPGDQKLDLP